MLGAFQIITYTEAIHGAGPSETQIDADLSHQLGLPLDSGRPMHIGYTCIFSNLPITASIIVPSRSTLAITSAIFSR